MKLEIKEIDGVPVIGIPDGSRTDVVHHRTAVGHGHLMVIIWVLVGCELTRVKIDWWGATREWWVMEFHDICQSKGADLCPYRNLPLLIYGYRGDSSLTCCHSISTVCLSVIQGCLQSAQCSGRSCLVQIPFNFWTNRKARHLHWPLTWKVKTIWGDDISCVIGNLSCCQISYSRKEKCLFDGKTGHYLWKAPHIFMILNNLAPAVKLWSTVGSHDAPHGL